MIEGKHIYVCGFVFSMDQSQVLLMLKQKPLWQMGRYNGIGGSVELGESSWDAMQRELSEEVSGIFQHPDPASWRVFCSLECQKAAIDFWFSFADITDASARELERVQVFPVHKLPPNILPGLSWLIPMALSLTRGENCASFIVKESYLNES